MIEENDMEVFGLNRNLTRIYKAILQSKGLSPAQLEKATGINRTNIYPLAQQLVENKLVNLDFVGSKRRYTARDPEIIKEMAIKRLETIEKYMPELKALYGSGSIKPKISYYEGDMAAHVVFDELTNVKGDNYCYFGSLSAQLALENLDSSGKYIKKRLKRGISTRSIRTKAADEVEHYRDSKKYLREIRYFPQKMPDDMPDIYIYDNSLAVLATHMEQYALIIDSPELSKMVRAIFEIVWKVSLKTDQKPED
ncbi:MAG: hypothetical protein LBF38_00270 [Deltaproteobacteria bacterium]|jgi:sugar-specific transcriptional regulator TrmB|nr:hypothetical protein [Deltaproteobacteria bacterium]